MAATPHDVSSTRFSPRLDPQTVQAVRAILDQPAMTYIKDPSFKEPGIEKSLFAARAGSLPRPSVDWYHPGMDLLHDQREINTEPNCPLTAAQEQQLFKQFNYARRQVRRFQRSLPGKTVGVRHARQLLDWYQKVHQLRELIVQYNLGLVLTMIKPFSQSNHDFNELVSEGHLVLLRSVDKFDASRNYKFSTYACRSIIRALGRLGTKNGKRRRMFPAGFEPDMAGQSTEDAASRVQVNEYISRIHDMMEGHNPILSKLEHEILCWRFPLAEQADRERITLKQVGEMIGCTKERVRQIEKKALAKIRTQLEEQFGSTPFESLAV